MPGDSASDPAPPGKPRLLTRRLLRDWPLPLPEGGDKEERGRVVVVGGAPEMPGAIILAAVAALRAGAGKLRIATCASIAPQVAVTVPEARVYSLPETASGAIAVEAVPKLAELAATAGAFLIGPGMVDQPAVDALMAELLPHLDRPACGAPVILDAAALGFLADAPRALRGLEGAAILTPHAGEMAAAARLDKEAVAADQPGTAARSAREFGAVVALKGAVTYIADPVGKIYCNRAGNVGLATSGSGDTLAGIIAGLAARGAEPLQAAAWGVFLHATAGDRLARRMGRLGFLARELLAEVPPLMAELE